MSSSTSFSVSTRAPAGGSPFSAPLATSTSTPPYGRNGFYGRLSQLQAPALFVWGSHDTIIPPAFGRHVSRWLPSAEQIVLDGCGHVPQVERAAQTSRLLKRFFGRVDALGPLPKNHECGDEAA